MIPKAGPWKKGIIWQRKEKVEELNIGSFKMLVDKETEKPLPDIPFN